MQETPLDSRVRRIPWRRDRLPTPVSLGFPGGSAGKESACNVGDLGSVPRLGRSSGEGNSYPLQYSGLENSVYYTVHGVAKSQTQLSGFHFMLHWRQWTNLAKFLKSFVSFLSCVCVSHVWLFVTPWTSACQTLLSMEFSRQKYWNGLPCPPPGDLPDPGIKPGSPALQAYSLPAEPPGKSHEQKWHFKLHE